MDQSVEGTFGPAPDSCEENLPCGQLGDLEDLIAAKSLTLKEATFDSQGVCFGKIRKNLDGLQSFFAGKENGRWPLVFEVGGFFDEGVFGDGES